MPACTTTRTSRCSTSSRRGSQQSATLFNFPQKVKERDRLAARMEEGDFWNDSKAAQRHIEELKVVRAQIEPLESAMKAFEDARVGYEMAKEANDQ